MKLTNEEVKELEKYFNPKKEIIKGKLPDAKGIKEFTTIYVKDGVTYIEYIMLEGNWKLVSTIS